ncbi:MAG: hypothetical protein U0T75_11000 [Chitinophagales bacterium]
MKSLKLYAPVAILALGLSVLSSCSKQQDDLTNLPVERKDNTQAQRIDAATITSDMVLADRVNGVDYIITSDVQVNANLTIKPGVTVMFAEGAGLQVNEQGSLTAIGAQSNEVLFTSETGKRGSWKGITILSNNGRNVLSFCKIEQGGGNGQGNVVVGSATTAAQVEISNSSISTSNKDGIVINEGSKVLNFNGNKLFTNSGFPVSMHISDAVNMENGNTYSNNGKEFIKVSGEVVNKPITLKKLNESFLISGQITATKGFTISAGSRIYMDNDVEVVIDGTNNDAFFNAVGTQAQPITLSAIYNGTGVWTSIKFRNTNSNNNQIEYCTISGGGMTTVGPEGMVSVTNTNGGSSNIVIRHSSIMNSAATGIYIQSANSEYNSDIINSNTFVNCAKGDVHIE